MSMMLHRELDPRQAVETPFPDSRWVVMKFGGRSVSTAENWARIHRLLLQRIDEGVEPVVCHSALAGVSNALVALLQSAIAASDTGGAISQIVAQHEALAVDLGIDPGVVRPYFEAVDQLVSGIRLVGEISPRVHARVLAAGELAATALGAAYLQKCGMAATWFDARQLLLSETIEDQSERGAFLSARCSSEPSEPNKLTLGSVGGVAVTQGFIAQNEHGETVLLGRGGSDTSASYLAARLEARRLEIWTDVPGFFSADPRIVPAARLIKSLHYEEAQEIASAGGGILHPRSISPVRRSGIPLFLKSTVQPELDGTIISSAVATESPQLKAISQRSGINLISMESLEMWHQVGFLANAFAMFRKHGLSVDLISTSESNVTVSVDTIQNVTNDVEIAGLVEDLESICRVRVIRDCAAITLVGRRIRAILHELSPVLELFEEHKVHLVTQAATDLNLSFVVDSEHAFRLVQRLHGLLVHRFAGGVFGDTWEQIDRGVEAAEMRPERSAWWLGRKDELVAIAHEHHAAYVYDSGSVETAVSALKSLSSIDAVFYAMKANSNAGILKIVDRTGGNFECVSPGEIRLLLDLFPQIDRSRILFTPNFAPRSEYQWGREQGVWLTVDNLFVLREWGEIFRGAEIFVRIDTGQGRGHHEHVRTAGVHSKFGVPLFELEELAQSVAKAGARVVGLHAHTGSGVLSPGAWRETGECLLSLIEQFPDVRYLDIGGGLGIPEKPGQVALDLAAFNASLTELKANINGREIWIEPGRYVVANAGVLVAEVTQTKGKGDMQYVGVTAGMNALIRPALYGAYHEIVNITRLDEAATELVTVVGPICETGDRLGSDRMMPQAQEGDVFLVANVGAYGKVMSSRYNLRDEVPEFII
jgi:diaminopimelate decarboxylase/aspartate kinase